MHISSFWFLLNPVEDAVYDLVKCQYDHHPAADEHDPDRQYARKFDQHIERHEIDDQANGYQHELGVNRPWSIAG